LKIFRAKKVTGLEAHGAGVKRRIKPNCSRAKIPGQKVKSTGLG